VRCPIAATHSVRPAILGMERAMITNAARADRLL
jgi:hypothetical protein